MLLLAFCKRRNDLVSCQIVFIEFYSLIKLPIEIIIVVTLTGIKAVTWWDCSTSRYSTTSPTDERRGPFRCYRMITCRMAAVPVLYTRPPTTGRYALSRVSHQCYAVTPISHCLSGIIPNICSRFIHYHIC